MKKGNIKSNYLNFKLATSSEIGLILGQRIRTQRLLKNLKQEELAQMSGVSVGTIKNLETKGQSSLDTFIRVAMALNLQDELSKLFEIKMTSIEQMEKLEELTQTNLRKRAR